MYKNLLSAMAPGLFWKDDGLLSSGARVQITLEALITTAEDDTFIYLFIYLYTLFTEGKHI